MFIDDKLPPSAVLIEYIPGMQQFDLTNFSEERMSTLSRALEEMHQVGVIHGDPMPRNMMIQTLSEGRERILWIDFDSSMTFPENVELTPRQATWVREEVEMVDYFAKAMVRLNPGSAFAKSILTLSPGSGLEERETEAGLLVLL